jgi:SAM-dependent methyltransferase
MLREQFGNPHGLVGRLAGRFMTHRNLERNRWAVGLLDVKPTDRCLELGFGPGLAIGELAAAAPDGQVLGIDHSALMVESARRRNQAAGDAGRVDLRVGDADDPLPFKGPFDAVLAGNTTFFWRDPAVVLERVAGAMAPGGRLAVVVQPRFRGATDADALRIAEEQVALLESVGFAHTRVETLVLHPVDAGAAIGISP